MELKTMSAHYCCKQTGRNKFAILAYVVKCTARVSKLDNLYTRFETVQPLVTEAAVSSSLQTRFEIGAAGILKTEDTLAGLVEVLDERDIEVRHVGTETEVDIGDSGAVRAVDRDRATGQRPLGAVGDVSCLVDVGAWAW